MTDYFALLGQPRRPWLDPEEVKRAFHEKTRESHPDAQQEPGQHGTDAEFAAINEAWRILQDPKRRLHHLLSLAGRAPVAAGVAPPPEIAEMFSAVADATQGAGRVLQEAAATTNPLSRSLVQTKIVIASRRVNEALGRLQEMSAEAEAELRNLNESANEAGGDWLDRCEQLYFRFAYLTRWISQLEEKRTQLATC